MEAAHAAGGYPNTVCAVSGRRPWCPLHGGAPGDGLRCDDAERMWVQSRPWLSRAPSGHLIVTTALVVAAVAMAPALRVLGLIYLAAVAVATTRAAGLLPQDVRVAISRRPAAPIRTPIAMPSAAPASTSSQK
jgi:hypothetical protein